MSGKLHGTTTLYGELSELPYRTARDKEWQATSVKRIIDRTKKIIEESILSGTGQDKSKKVWPTTCRE